MQEMQEAQVRSLGQEDPLEEEMAIHSSILAWENPTGQRSLEGLQSMGLHVPSKRLPDWASLELSPSIESCGCGLGPSPVRLG